MKNQKHYTSMQLKSLKIKAEEMQTKKYLKKREKIAQKSILAERFIGTNKYI